MSVTAYTEDFPIAKARRIVADLFIPNPLIYWVDFLFHATLGWAAFALTVVSPAWSVWQAAAFVVMVFALYRAVIFTHELAHLKKGTFRAFRLVWNVVCGFPLMVPSFTYHGVHNNHHKQRVYGTKNDGEYVAYALKGPASIVGYLALAPALPLALALRFILVTPFAYVHKGIRRFAWERASSLEVDLGFRRAIPKVTEVHDWKLQELATCAYGVTALVLVTTGILPFQVLIVWYLGSAAVFLLNSLRTLAAHRYRNPEDQVLSFPEQFFDSINVPGNLFLTALWAPVGLRYHALHHLFPNMPYHALGKAHQRLMTKLPDSALYIKTERKSLWHTLATLWAEACAGPQIPAITKRGVD